MASRRQLNIPGRIGVVRVQVDQAQVAAVLYSGQGEVGQDVQRRAYAVQKRMKRLAPVDTGQLRNSIRVESVRESSKGPISKVYADAPHAIVAEVGRRGVRAGGAYQIQANRRTRRSGSQVASGSLRWGTDPGTVSPPRLAFLNKQGKLIRPIEVGPAEGAKYILRSIDAALD